jgi:hypothetical protein
MTVPYTFANATVSIPLSQLDANFLAVNVATINNFVGTGVQTSFTLSYAPINENATQVFINGVYQNKSTYSVSSATLIFSEAPPFNSSIEVELY